MHKLFNPANSPLNSTLSIQTVQNRQFDKIYYSKPTKKILDVSILTKNGGESGTPDASGNEGDYSS